MELITFDIAFKSRKVQAPFLQIMLVSTAAQVKSFVTCHQCDQDCIDEHKYLLTTVKFE